MPACCAGAAGTGPGFATPRDAFEKGEREHLAFVPVTSFEHSRPDYLATIDLDTSQIISRLPMPHLGDELHHSGWNTCSSCFGVPGASRSRLILPALGSSRLYSVDVSTNPREPRLDKEVAPEDIAAKTGLAWPHTSHCLGDGNIMVSFMGDTAGAPKGAFLLFDQAMSFKGVWSKEEAPFGYDYWYQPRLGVMISSGWGTPAAFSKGFNPADVAEGRYADALYVWDWRSRKLAQTISLGADGAVPLELRFLHDPSAATGFVGAALASNVLRFYKQDADADGGVGKWAAEVVIRQESVPVEGWALPAMPPLITDILIAMDDRFLYFSNWLRGDVCQYDITDPAAPKLVGQLFLGGSIRKGGGVTVTSGPFCGAQPEVPTVRGKELVGGPQMLQLSLDGKRLYVTSSLFSPWDKQFYPAMQARGSWMLRLNVDTERGGLTLDEDFFVDFGDEPGGPGLAHEIRFPGGDCTSDIWY